MSLGSRFLKRILVVAFLLLCLPCEYSRAQGFPFTGGMAPFTWGSVTITPSVKIGYERIGFNFNLPLANGNALDLKLQNANLGLGGLGFLAGFGDQFAMFVNAEATLQKNLVVSTSQEPFEAGRFSVSWTGSQFQQGYLEAGFLYRWSGDISLVGGVRRTRLMMRLTDPRDGFGQINFTEISAVSFGFPPFFQFTFSEFESQRYFADFNTGIWMPFLGVRLKGLNYTASLIGSPVGWVQLAIPLRLQQREFANVAIPFRLFGTNGLFSFSDNDDRESQINYKFNKTGVFLEGDFEYDLPLGRGFGINLWARGNWMHFKGSGSAGYTLDVTDQDAFFLRFGNATLLNFQSFIKSSSASSASAQGSLNIYTYSLGASATLSF